MIELVYLKQIFDRTPNLTSLKLREASLNRDVLAQIPTRVKDVHIVLSAVRSAELAREAFGDFVSWHFEKERKGDSGELVLRYRDDEKLRAIFEIEEKQKSVQARRRVKGLSESANGMVEVKMEYATNA
mgnify:CR=1 FL=1